MKVNCQHSKLEFETSSKRTKQHPMVAAFKNENARNYYSEALQALDEVSQVGGYSTIEEYMALVKETFSANVAVRREREKRLRQDAMEAERQLAERKAKVKAERDAQNKILKEHGYRWRLITQDELDDNDDFETEPGWHLYAPDGREVTVERALREIEFGVEAVAEEERKKREDEEAKVRHQRELEKMRSQVIQVILANGIQPWDEQPSGERILDTANIYGGGDWFVIGTDAIWYCQNNGADGDDWSRNNVRTGGAGAVGWKIPMDTDVEDTLRAIAEGKTLEQYRSDHGL